MPDLASLRAEALAARAAADHDRAVRGWRALLDAAPDDWALALELRHDLAAGWHNPNGDPRFRRAARGLPDAEWLAHYGSGWALPGPELGAIVARARGLAARRPADARVHLVLGHAARQSRGWDDAAQAFDAAHRLDPAHPGAAQWASEARQYARLAEAACAPGFTDGPPDYELTVINLDANTERMAEIERLCAGFPVLPRRLAGVVGLSLPRAAALRLAGDASAPRGTLGCTLSHVAAWQRLLDGDAPAALVLEDDAVPLVRFPARIAALGLPAGWDMVWVNDRMQPVRDPAITSGFSVVPASAVVAGFRPWQDAVGADGYLVSRAGARTLLEWVAADGLAGDVDWRMLAYAMHPAELAGLPADGAARRLLEAFPMARSERLAAFALHPALVREVSMRSDRQDTDRACRGR